MFGTSETKTKPSNQLLPENQIRSNSKLGERGLFLDISVEETYQGKLLTN